MARGCTRIAFQFEGYHTHAHVHVVAMVDFLGEFILDHDRILKWKPDNEKLLGDLLDKAAEVFLDGHLPRRRGGDGDDANCPSPSALVSTANSSSSPAAMPR